VAGLGTLAAALYGGYGQGKQQKYQDQLAQQQQEQEATYQSEQTEIERERLAQEARQLAATNRQYGLDENGNPIPLPVPQGGAPKPIPLPVGQKGAPATADQMANYYADVAAQNLQLFHDTGDARYLDAAKEYDQLSQAKGYLNVAKAGEATARASEAPSRIQLNLARAQAARTAQQTAIKIAQGHDAASIQRAALSTQGAAWRAQLSANTRKAVAQYDRQSQWAIAQLAGAYHLQGINAEDATKQAIADFEGQVKTNIANARPYPDTDTAPPEATVPPFQALPPININVGTPGFAGALPPLPVPPLVAPPAKTGTAGTQPSGGGASPVEFKAYLNFAQNAVKRNWTAHDIRQRLNDLVTQGKLSAQQARQIEQQTSLPSGQNLLPLPVGGSQAATPF